MTIITMTVATCGAFRFFANTTFDCFCLLCACVSVMMRICVRVFPFYHLYYLQSFLCFYIFELPWYVSFLCFNQCSAFEYCYRYQRFINKLLLLLLRAGPIHNFSCGKWPHKVFQSPRGHHIIQEANRGDIGLAAHELRSSQLCRQKRFTGV